LVLIFFQKQVQRGWPVVILKFYRVVECRGGLRQEEEAQVHFPVAVWG
jgi:hypothetical protein